MDHRELQVGLRVRYKDTTAVPWEMTITEFRLSEIVAVDDLNNEYRIQLGDIPLLENISASVSTLGDEIRRRFTPKPNRWSLGLTAYESDALAADVKKQVSDLPRAKIKLVLDDPEDQRIWKSALKTAERVAKWPDWKKGNAPLPFVPSSSIRPKNLELLQEIYNYLTRQPQGISTEDLRIDLNIGPLDWEVIAGHGKRSLIHRIAKVRKQANTYIWTPISNQAKGR